MSPRNDHYANLVGGVGAWDDMRFPASGINYLGVTDEPDTSTTDGTLLFDPTTAETIAVQVQLPHSWKEGSAIKPHVHWCKTTSAAGTVVWSMLYAWANVGDVMPALANLTTATAVVSDEDTADLHAISTFGEIDATGKTVSSMLLIVLGRLATSDTYGADAKLFEFDIHYQIDALGSEGEFAK